MDEILDVVNEQNEIVGQAPRSEVHRQGLRHRAVHVLVFNGDRQLFLQKRSQSKETDPGCWDSSAAGHVDQGESYDACAIRELGEELGVFLNAPPDDLFSLEACQQTGLEFVQVYLLNSDGPFRLHPEEIETGDWFPIGQIEEWIERAPEEFAPSFLVIWERFRSHRDAVVEE